jgi:hypothetical protein
MAKSVILAFYVYGSVFLENFESLKELDDCAFVVS